MIRHKRSHRSMHTATPWMVDPNDKTRIIEGVGKQTIAEIWDSNGERSHKVAAANAAFIVTAANMHSALWNALENLAELVETNLITEEVSKEAWEQELQIALKVLYENH